MNTTPSRTLCLLLVLLFSPQGLAQQSEMFGPYELHYSVLNSTFIAPEIAQRYGITRGKKRGIVNLAVREHRAEGSDTIARPMLLKGRTWDLMQNQTLEFQEVREGPAVYYIAEFKFINEEWRFFELHFRPEGAEKTYTFQFKHQLYTD